MHSRKTGFPHIGQARCRWGRGSIPALAAPFRQETVRAQCGSQARTVIARAGVHRLLAARARVWASVGLPAKLLVGALVAWFGVYCGVRPQLGKDVAR